MLSNKVCLRHQPFNAYPKASPFDPSISYPEYGSNVSTTANPVYDMIRLLLKDLKLDLANFDMPDWNPLKSIIRPGDRVVIKPNLVVDSLNQDCVTTHASVIRPIVDYVWKALDGKGIIEICDAPVVYADFNLIIESNGLKDMVSQLVERGYRLTLIDLRALKSTLLNDVVIDEVFDQEKKNDSILVDLKNDSQFESGGVLLKHLAYGAYNRKVVDNHHARGRHQYRISKRILEADVIISVPKYKTHKKSGITCCLKNLVGINVDKNCLPHFTNGPANFKGDEFPKIAPWRILVLYLFKLTRFLFFGTTVVLINRSMVAKTMALFGFKKHKTPYRAKAGNTEIAKKIYKLITGFDYAGSWQGNETIWRMILDLNRIFLYADRKGKICEDIQRKVMYFVDGLIAGDSEGPLVPEPVRLGVCAAGYDAVKIDEIMMSLTGVDSSMIPLYREIKTKNYPWLINDYSVEVVKNGESVSAQSISPIIRFSPPPYWHFST